MSFTRCERLVLANQYRILRELAKLTKCADEDYDTKIEILERGYEGDYYAIYGEVEANTFGEDQSTRVHNILEMYSALQRAVGKGLGSIKPSDVRLPGFDGNNETDELAYTKFLRDKLHKWENLSVGGDEGNSHLPTHDMYERQLAEWQKAANKHQLTEAEVQAIHAARVHPGNRHS